MSIQRYRLNGSWADWPDEYGDWVRADDVKTLEEENLELRKQVWLTHGCSFSSLYGDDGEMQCCKCMIDFKRDPVDTILDKIQKKAMQDYLDKVKKAVE